MAINKTTTDLSTLKINYLTQQMYEDALENDEINENELYITPGSVSIANWVNGSATNSVRTTGSAAEGSGYTMGAGAVAEGNSTQARGQNSHAEGQTTLASGNCSHAEGISTTASGDYGAHAEGGGTTASSGCAHAEGGGTIASGQNSHAEGQTTLASGNCSHAEGNGTTANGNYSHAEGISTTASGIYSHAEGSYTIANHRAQHVFGAYNIADPSTELATAKGNYIEIVGNGTGTSVRSNARTLDWSGNEVLAGKLTVGVAGTNSMDVATVGQIPTVWVNGSAANSVRTTGSVVESSSYTMGAGAVAEGSGTKASGDYSHAEGGGTIASGQGSHAEGAGTRANNSCAHAEGGGTTASGTYSHAEGVGTTASGTYSHAEGGNTTASGDYSHAEGTSTTASGQCSHAEGMNTIANHMAQHVFGAYNIADSSAAASTILGNYVEIVGNGAYNAPSNARTLDWSGNEWLAGKLTIGTNPTAAMDVVTKQYMENQGYLTLATLPIYDGTVV